MAETLISPGVLARENDQSLVTAKPLTKGAAIIGPTVKGPVEKPVYISSFSSFETIFGGALESGSTDYTYLTSIAANNYFQQGGESLLVTRVTSGSFTPALSTTIENNIESPTAGLVGNLVSSLTSGGSGGFTGTYASGVITSNGNGTGATLTVVTSTGNGKLIVADELNITTNTTVTTIDASTAALTGWTTSGNGEGATFIVTSLNDVVDTVEVVAPGTGFVAGDTITIPASILNTDGSLGTVTGNLVITVLTANLLVEITAANVVQDGEGYAAGDTITVQAGNIGASDANAVFTLTNANIENQNTFVLETISEGIIMNNTFPLGSDTSCQEGANGTLVSGSADNIRWEINSVNTSSGVFSLVVRRGNDNNTQKIILESFNNISLDPFSPNYISRAIGDMSTTLIVAGDGSGTYLQESGSYPNVSNYVRVKQVNANTPHYFDNNGIAKSEYTASLPQLGSGSFDQAVGSNINFYQANNFYENINSANTQGLIGTDYTNAINLLANQDDYQYNVIAAPGLYYSNYGAQCNLIKNNCISRGDCIYIMDLVPYNTDIVTVVQNAAAIDSSYAAAYWPWLQTIDPSTGLLVYVPASTMIPGVYAFTDASSDPWFAPAGITRGGLNAVVRAERKLTSTNRDTLYEANVNPIATFPQQGVVVFGQKTLQKAATALDRINVRRLLIALKGYISQIADNLVFEQNTIATRQNFLTQVNPYLESVQQRQGLYAFKVVMDETNNTPDAIDRNELIGQIYVQPTKTAEFIILDFNVLPTGATFPG